MKKTLLLIAACCLQGMTIAQEPVYRQASAPIEERVSDLLGRMTLEEKSDRSAVLWDGKCTPKSVRTVLPSRTNTDNRWTKLPSVPTGLFSVPIRGLRKLWKPD